MEEMLLRDVWKSAAMESGGLCVMTSGVLLMPKWYADSLDSAQQVRHISWLDSRF